jgi:hypothetical protein
MAAIFAAVAAYGREQPWRFRKKGNDLLGNISCGCYLEDCLIRTNGHPGAELVTLQEAQTRFEQPSGTHELKVGVASR